MKLLVVRFSSIGDVVLTTPVLRCIAQQHPNVTIHYITKQAYAGALAYNPYIAKLHTFSTDIDELLPALKTEQYDAIIDLHNNLRSRRLSAALGVKSYRFKKLNIEKWLLVNFKINKLPNQHIVDRYLAAAQQLLPLVNDNKGLDFFTSTEDEALAPTLPHGYVALVLAATYYTKKISQNKLVEICNAINHPIVLVGGPAESLEGEALAKLFPNKVDNYCGKATLGQSAVIVKYAHYVVTPDTGIMHIAAAFKKHIYSVWGNTVPAFGMIPYLPAEGSKILEVEGLGCRPCSKLGKSQCPKGHFKCMQGIDFTSAFQD